MTDKTPASRQLLNITKAALDSAERECETIRNQTIEECAKVVLDSGEDKEVCDYLATVIRALKDKQP